MAETPRAELFESLEAYGADLGRWPEAQRRGAREAVLASPDFRDAYDRERAVDRMLDEARTALDTEIAASGAVERVRRAALARRSANPLAGLPWQRVAAAVLVAAMLGGALDILVLPDPPSDPAELALIDPVDGGGP